jgi:hypothetical protein
MDQHREETIAAVALLVSRQVGFHVLWHFKRSSSALSFNNKNKYRPGGTKYGRTHHPEIILILEPFVAFVALGMAFVHMVL